MLAVSGCAGLTRQPAHDPKGGPDDRRACHNEGVSHTAFATLTGASLRTDSERVQALTFEWVTSCSTARLTPPPLAAHLVRRWIGRHTRRFRFLEGEAAAVLPKHRLGPDG